MLLFFASVMDRNLNYYYNKAMAENEPKIKKGRI